MTATTTGEGIGESRAAEARGDTLRGRVAFVTGGTRGIGAAISKSLASPGATVVAGYGRKDIARLMADPGIIRNRLKIEAAIANAGRILQLQASHGSFAAWLDAHHPLSKDEWVKLFNKTFRFTGGEITGEFLMSIGYLRGAHAESCPVHKQIAKLNPRWMESAQKAVKR